MQTLAERDTPATQCTSTPPDHAVHVQQEKGGGGGTRTKLKKKAACQTACSPWRPAWHAAACSGGAAAGTTTTATAGCPSHTARGAGSATHAAVLTVRAQCLVDELEAARKVRHKVNRGQVRHLQAAVCKLVWVRGRHAIGHLHV